MDALARSVRKWPECCTQMSDVPPLSPSEQGWYVQFCAELSESVPESHEVTFAEVAEQLEAFLRRTSPPPVCLTRKGRECLIKKTVFEMNLPTQVRSRAGSQEV